MGSAATAVKPFSFSRLYRLSKPAEFQQVFDRAQRSADRYFTVLYRPNDGDSARIGFVIAKKRVARAVGRNRIRRIARESFRLQRNTLGALDIIILCQNAADKADRATLFASLDKHWLNLSLQKNQGRRRRPTKDRAATKDE